MITLEPYVPHASGPVVYKIWWWTDDESKLPPVAEFLLGLQQPQPYGKAQAWVDRLAVRGRRFIDGDHCKQIGDNLYEVRPFPVRLIFFLDGPNAIFVVGFTKDTDSIPRRYIELAEQRKLAYFAAKTNAQRGSET